MGCCATSPKPVKTSTTNSPMANEPTIKINTVQNTAPSSQSYNPSKPTTNPSSNPKL